MTLDFNTFVAQHEPPSGWYDHDHAMRAYVEYRAAELGRAAFDAGKMRVPCLDVEFNDYLKTLNDPTRKLPTGTVIAALDAWLKAWDTANLAAPLEVE